MPLYEYECGNCGRRTEKIQKFSDEPLKECPYCGGPLERLIHAPAVSFKGGGWYADLYSSSKKSGAAGDGKAGASKEAAASTSESKPASSSSSDSSSSSSASSTTSSDKK